MLGPRGVAFTEAICKDSVSAVFLNKGYQMSLHLLLNLKCFSYIEEVKSRPMYSYPWLEG